MHPIALTPGEPAGIGPDLALQLFERGVDIPTVVVADAEMLADRADALDANVELYPIEEGFEAPRPGLMAVHHVPCRAPVIAGVLSPGMPVMFWRRSTLRWMELVLVAIARWSQGLCINRSSTKPEFRFQDIPNISLTKRAVGL